MTPHAMKHLVRNAITAVFALLLLSVSATIARAADADLKLNSTDGSTKFTVQNQSAVEVSSITSLGDGYFRNVYSTLSPVTKRVAVTQTLTSTTKTDLVNMTFNLPINEVWTFEFNLQNGCNGAAGTTYDMTVPAGASFNAVAMGMTTGVTAITSSIMTVSGTSSIAFNTVNLATGWTKITGTVVNAGTAGPVTLQYNSVNGGQTSSVFAGSYMVARKAQN